MVDVSEVRNLLLNYLTWKKEEYEGEEHFQIYSDISFLLHLAKELFSKNGPSIAICAKARAEIYRFYPPELLDWLDSGDRKSHCMNFIIFTARGTPASQPARTSQLRDIDEFQFCRYNPQNSIDDDPSECCRFPLWGVDVLLLHDVTSDKPDQRKLRCGRGAGGGEETRENGIEIKSVEKRNFSHYTRVGKSSR